MRLRKREMGVLIVVVGFFLFWCVNVAQGYIPGQTLHYGFASQDSLTTIDSIKANLVYNGDTIRTSAIDTVSRGQFRFRTALPTDTTGSFILFLTLYKGALKYGEDFNFSVDPVTPFYNGSSRVEIYTYNASDSSALPNTGITIYTGDSSEVLWAAYSATGAANLILNMPADSYFVRASQPGYYASNTALVVSGDTTVSLYLSPMAIPLLPDTQYCRIVFSELNPDNTIPEGDIVKARISRSPIIYGGSSSVATRTVETSIDSMGRAHLDILRNLYIEITIPSSGIVATGQVPDTSVIGFLDIYPNIDSTSTRWITIKKY